MTRLERARDRESIRYYEAWLGSRRGYLPPENQTTYPRPPQEGQDGTIPIRKISRDKALVAFAQLGALRLNAKRGIVTLATASTLYFLAEATQTVSLLTGSQYNDGDELWFGTASIPRSQGVSEHALHPPSHTAKSSNGYEFTAPALVIPDVTQDPRFSTKAYAGTGVTFYAGVPIVSKNGFAVGVYNVTDDKPRPARLSPGELKFMQDMAATVMDHLKNIYNDTARHRGERMVLGLGAFTEGHASLGSSNPDIKTATESSSRNPEVVTIPSDFRGFTISETPTRAPKPTLAANESTSSLPKHSENEDTLTREHLRPSARNPIAISEDFPHSSQFLRVAADAEFEDSPAAPKLAPQDQSSHSIEYRRTFARAANILRECTDSDGVVFFDASSASVLDVHQGFFGIARTFSTESSTSSDDASHTSGGSSDEFTESIPDNDGHFSLKRKAYPRPSRRRTKAKHCESLEFSSQTPGTHQLGEMVLKETEMHRLLRKYPKGMIMHFAPDGGVSSSSSSSEEAKVKKSIGSATPFFYDEKKRAIAQELIKVVPGARSIVWLPLWNFSRSRFAAGCFIWTSRPGRLLTAQEDLTYMKAFANTVMGEINRLEAVASDQAKASFIANISHELRSPLHGILGSIELLQDTAIDAFQVSMITTVETCGKTLLDTVNHVLKLGKLSKQSKQSKQKHEHLNRRTSINDRSSIADEKVDLSELLEEAVESVYAGQTFRSTGAFLANDDDGGIRDTSLHEQPYKRRRTQGALTNISGAVRIILDVENLDSWCVHTNPGAIRRIVMNLFGNALKYIEKGFIRISLTSSRDAPIDPSQLSFCITVSDTGKGMTADFIKHYAWRPFSQEDSFANGVGLGLSIVRQITNSLGGETSLQSQRGEGTTVSVTVTAPRAMLLEED